MIVVPSAREIKVIIVLQLEFDVYQERPREPFEWKLRSHLYHLTLSCSKIRLAIFCRNVAHGKELVEWKLDVTSIWNRDEREYRCWQIPEKCMLLAESAPMSTSRKSFGDSKGEVYRENAHGGS